MCGFSATAENSRSAQRGELLIVTQSPHSGWGALPPVNWVTEPGKPNIAVCLLGGTTLAIECPGQPVRGAIFEEIEESTENRSHTDFLVFEDNGERMSINQAPVGTSITPLVIPEKTQQDVSPDISGAVQGEVPAPISQAPDLQPELASLRRPVNE